MSVTSGVQLAPARRVRWTLTPLVAAILTGLLYTVPLSSLLKMGNSDQLAHLNVAVQVWEEGTFFPHPHWLYQALVILVHIVVPWISWLGCALLVMGAAYAGLGLVVGTSLQAVLGRPTSAPDAALLIVLTVATVIAAPVSLFTWPFGNIYFGYLNIDGYQNPTHSLLRPLAALILVLAVRVFTLEQRRWDIPILAVTTMLAALAKPSLHITLLPAIALLAGAYLLLNRPLRIGLLLFGIIGPSILLLIPQFLAYFQASLPTTALTATSDGERSQIILAPLLVMGSASQALGPKFVLSILFPLAVLVCYRRLVVYDPLLQLTWLLFLFGAFYTYMLAESRGTLDGNFVWSGQITTGLLLFATTLFFFRQATGRHTSILDTCRSLLQGSLATRLCLLAFALHVVSGILFYVYPVIWGA